VSEQDRIDRLEQRLHRLEQLMRQVLRALPASAVSDAGEVPPPPTAVPPPAPELPTPRSTPATPPPLARPVVPPAAPALDGEQWVGQRGLLAVGVIAVILAAGYLLKLSFDRGWISPLLRCIGGGVVGVTVAGIGLGLHRRGYRTYGPALVGTGAAIAYVTVWAASQLYGFLPPMSAVLTMALVAILLAGAAWVMATEALASAAALGAFLAPMVIGNVDADADRLLAYLAAMAFTLGAVAWSKRWRVTTLLIGLSYFGLGVLAAEDATPLVALVYGAAGGGAGLALGLKYDWWETRFLSFWGGWSCLVFADSPTTAPLVLVAGMALSYPVWAHALQRDGVWPFEGNGEGRRSVLPSLYFYATPFWLVWAVGRLGLGAFEAHDGLATALVALAYVAIGVTGTRRPFAIVGAIALVVATLLEWESTLISAAVLGTLALVWGGIGRVSRRVDWNFHAILALGIGILTLWTEAERLRPPDTPAFMDSWALVFWGLLAVNLTLVTEFAAPDDEASSPRKAVLWVAAGVSLWLGMTAELTRYFDLRMVDAAAGRLAGGLAVSVWWLLFAGACILAGFRRTIRPLRLGGLWVAGLAVMKVLIVDLSTLDALYRVASVFGLGLVSLLVAWAYHRRAKLERTDAPSDR
jgi:predicted membrane protein DUF2339